MRGWVRCSVHRWGISLWSFALAAVLGPGGLTSKAATAQAPSDLTRRLAEAAEMARRAVEANLPAYLRSLQSLPANDQRSIADCLANYDPVKCAPPPNPFETPEQREVSQVLADAREASERAAVLAFLRLAAKQPRTLETILSGTLANAGNLLAGAYTSLSAFAAVIRTTTAVDPRFERIAFSTGLLNHCFSPRPLCDGKFYDAVRR